MSSTPQVIEVVVAPSGEATVQTKGFAGAGCREASRFVERALGAPTAERLTAEFYMAQTAEAQARQRE